MPTGSMYTNIGSSFFFSRKLCRAVVLASLKVHTSDPMSVIQTPGSTAFSSVQAPPLSGKPADRDTGRVRVTSENMSKWTGLGRTGLLK